MDQRRRFEPEKLEEFTAKVFTRLHIPDEEARIASNSLIHSDLRGVESHGLAHLAPFYVRWIKEGKVKINPGIKITSILPVSATIDGDSGLGFIAGYKAMNEAIQRAEKNGAGFVTVKNSTHFGAAAYYAMMPLQYDMIGIAMTAGGRVVMAPGSSQKATGSNPIALAVPADQRHPFVLDMSTSVVSYGKIEIAQREGGKIPLGWVVNEKGQPVTDVSEIDSQDTNWKGGLLPLGGLPETGGFKGFGLAVFVDILCTLLSGSPLGSCMNHFFGAIKINGFQPAKEFKKQMDRLIDYIENLPTLPGTKKLYAAGGYEDKIMKDRLKNGIPLEEDVIQTLKELSRELKIKNNLGF